MIEIDGTRFSHDDIERLQAMLAEGDDKAIEAWLKQEPLVFPDREASDIVDCMTPPSSVIVKQLGLRTQGGSVRCWSARERVEDQILELGQCFLNELKQHETP